MFTVTPTPVSVAGSTYPVSGGPWTLGGFARPTGNITINGTTVPYVPIEQLGFTAGADPNKIIAAMKTPGVLTFPVGLFPFADFATGYLTGVNIPHGPSEGTNGNCWGIVGSGPGSLDRSTPGTYFQMTPGSSTKGSTVPPEGSGRPGQCVMMKAANTAGIALGQFRLCGTEQGHLYSGFNLYQPTAPCHIYDVCVDGWSGDANVPPGETCGFGPIGTLGAARIDHIFERVEADARRADGKRYGAAPMGGQNLNGTVWTDCYGHHAAASSVGFSQCRNVVTNRLRSEYNGTGSGTLSGSGLNHECTTGIVHNQPVLILDRSNGNTGVHVSHSNYAPQAANFLPGTVTVNQPVASDAFGNGVFQMQAFPVSVMVDTPQPVVVAPTTTTGEPMSLAWQHP